MITELVAPISEEEINLAFAEADYHFCLRTYQYYVDLYGIDKVQLDLKIINDRIKENTI